MISKKSKYAIKAILYIARHQERKEPVLSSEIAQHENIPHKFLEAILRDLRNAGILTSKRGRYGGYFLRKKPAEINFADIMRLFDGPIALLPCVSEKFYEPCAECTEEKSCVIRSVFQQVRAVTLDVLVSSDIEKLLKQ